MSAEYSPIVGCGLDQAEEEKLATFAERLQALFASVGHADVRYCDGSGSGENRSLTFRDLHTAHPICAVTSILFRTLEFDELAELITAQLPEEVRASQPLLPISAPRE